MVVGDTTTFATSAYHHCEIKSCSGQGVQHYVIKFVSNGKSCHGKNETAVPKLFSY
jgi:hypothetical protein